MPSTGQYWDMGARELGYSKKKKADTRHLVWPSRLGPQGPLGTRTGRNGHTNVFPLENFLKLERGLGQDPLSSPPQGIGDLTTAQG